MLFNLYGMFVHRHRFADPGIRHNRAHPECLKGAYRIELIRKHALDLKVLVPLIPVIPQSIT